MKKNADILRNTIFAGSGGSSAGGITSPGPKHLNVDYGKSITEDMTTYAEVEVTASAPTGSKTVNVGYGQTVTEDVKDVASVSVTALRPTGRRTIEIDESGTTECDVEKEAGTVVYIPDDLVHLK